MGNSTQALNSGVIMNKNSTAFILAPAPNPQTHKYVLARQRECMLGIPPVLTSATMKCAPQQKMKRALAATTANSKLVPDSAYNERGIKNLE